MTAIAKPFIVPFRLTIPRLFDFQQRRRRLVTIDLIHASPHLLRDIGVLEPKVTERRR